MGVLAQEIEATYEVLSRMGEGGMGAIYKVRHRFFDEIRVVKVMQADLELLPELKERFLGEAKRGKQLRHPNLAEVIDFSIASDGTSYIVMEYVDGVNLRELLARNGGPLDYRVVIPIAEQALAALDFLHSRKFVHRDISPDNIMLVDQSQGALQVKLIDLGIAKSLESTRQLTMAGKFLGKVQYASPEQFGGEVDGRSDIYAMGVVIYELLTNAKPVTGDTPMSLISGHLSRAPRSFEETDPGRHIPAALRQVILKALEKDPAKRHATAAAFAEALRATLPAGALQSTELPDVTRPATIPTAGEAVIPAVTMPMSAVPRESAAPVAKTAVSEPPRVVAAHPRTPLEKTEVSGQRGPAPERSNGRRYTIGAVMVLALVAALVLFWIRQRPATVPVVTARTNTLTAPPVAIPASTAVTVAAADERGALLINALPWGRVESVTDSAGVDHLSDGPRDTPLLLSLPAGQYTVRLTNPNANTTVQLVAIVTAGAVVRSEAELDRVDVERYVDHIGLGQ